MLLALTNRPANSVHWTILQKLGVVGCVEASLSAGSLTWTVKVRQTLGCRFTGRSMEEGAYRDARTVWGGRDKWPSVPARRAAATEMGDQGPIVFCHFFFSRYKACLKISCYFFKLLFHLLTSNKHLRLP